MCVDREEVAVALDAFPHWDENMRAEVYHAIDVAPDEPLSSWGQSDEYFKGEAHAAWMRIREYTLNYTTPNRWAVTLDEASGFESAPTKTEILKSLWRGEGMVR